MFGGETVIHPSLPRYPLERGTRSITVTVELSNLGHQFPNGRVPSR